MQIAVFHLLCAMFCAGNDLLGVCSSTNHSIKHGLGEIKVLYPVVQRHRGRKEWKRNTPPRRHIALKSRYRGWMEETWGESDKEGAGKVAGRKRGTRMVVPVEPLLIGPALLYQCNLTGLTGTTHDITVC